MSNELQKIAWETTRTGAEGGVNREPVLNTATGETSRGAELIVKDDTGTNTYRFSTQARLANTSVGYSGDMEIGTDDSAYTYVSGSTLKDCLDSIDSVLGSLSSFTGDNLSDGSIIFGIDENNDSTTETFTWRKNGSTSLMTLNESGALSLLSNPSRINFIDTNTNINYDGATLTLNTNQQIKLIASDEISFTSGGANNIRIDVNAFDIDNLASNNLRIRSNTSMHFNIDQNNDSTSESFLWHTNASTQIMKLEENGNLTLPTTTSTLYFGASTDNFLNINSSSQGELRSYDKLTLKSVSGAIELQSFSGVSVITNLLSLSASTTSYPSLRMPHGTAPTSPTNGDGWSTTSGFYGRVNGTTKKLDVSTLKELSDNSPVSADMIFKNKSSQEVKFQTSSSVDALKYDDSLTVLRGDSVKIIGNNSTSELEISGKTLFTPYTGLASINVGIQTTPTTLVNGDVWFDGTDFKARVGGVTKTFTLV
jgi:hypothetical protein